MLKQSTAAAIGLFILFAGPAQADRRQPSHMCSKPFKPYQFRDEYDRSNFRWQVEQYKQCIADFVEEQNDAIKKHGRAAEEAIDEWNSFVNFELR